MLQPLSCYYIDDALDEDELEIVGKTLLGPWARFKTGASELKQKRVPFVVAAPDAQGQYALSREQRAKRIASNMRRAGIVADRGRRVAWIMPRDISWDAIFQYAIRCETGLGPFVVQRRLAQDGELVRSQLRIIDTQILLQGL
jgi:hypothetical protein